MIEFLKNKADFENLHEKYKKPFRAHINKHQGAILGGETAPLESGSVLLDQAERGKTVYSDYFVSDGFHSVKCHFSNECKEAFDRAYPTSIKIFNTVNMLICVQSYFVELRSPVTGAGGIGTISPLSLF